jgi:chromosome segregation ATPase
MLIFKYILAICLIFALNLRAEVSEIQPLENNLQETETVLLSLSQRRTDLNNQANHLALEISTLKNQKDTGYFQRQRLESLLKSSQELTREIELLDKDIFANNQKLQSQCEQLIQKYDDQIKTLITQLKSKKLDKSVKKEFAFQLGVVKEKRELVQARIELGIQEIVELNQMALETDENPRQMREKAEWLLDQEKKLRKNAKELERIAKNLKDEIEIREKMVELEQDLTIFSHRDEPIKVGSASQTSNTDKRTGSPETVFGDFQNDDLISMQNTAARNNAYLQLPVTSKSSIRPLFPNLSIQRDATELSVQDIQTYIANLEKRKQLLLSTADSLKSRSEQLSKKAGSTQEK